MRFLSRGAGNRECRHESGARIDLKNLRACYHRARRAYVFPTVTELPSCYWFHHHSACDAD